MGIRRPVISGLLDRLLGAVFARRHQARGGLTRYTRDRLAGRQIESASLDFPRVLPMHAMDDKIEPSWPDERHEIIDKVQRGEMSPSEAQALVTERKLQPLKREPDLTEFDPLNEPDWTLLMAVTWIAYHSSDYVRKVWDKYREKCWNWSPCTSWRAPSPDGRSFVDYKGHFLKQETDASFEQLCLEEIVSLLRPPVPDDDSGVVKRHCVRGCRSANRYGNQSLHLSGTTSQCLTQIKIKTGCVAKAYKPLTPP
jgi:hypothetical protein